MSNVIAEERAPVATSPGLARRAGRAVQGVARLLVKFALGVALCQVVVTSVLVVGWTLRAMQRATYKAWWRRSPARRDGLSLEAFLDGGVPAGGSARLPNWIVAEAWRVELREAWRTRRGAFSALGRSIGIVTRALRANVKLGVQGLFNVWVFTLPGCVLWLFAWYDGWNNSFNKGYEQAPIGPLTGALGTLLFIAAMFYVPLAQARQAATGSWRSFYDFALLARLIRRRRVACCGLAAAYSLLSIPVTIFKTAPGFFPQMSPMFDAMSDRALHDYLVTYFLVATLVALPAYVLLRLLAARIYATGILALVRDGLVRPAELGEQERAALHRLNLLEQRERVRRHVLVRTMAGTMRTAVSAAWLTLTAILWFSFVAQVFVGEFLNYHLARGWLNQPLVQLPWFRYIPGGLLP